MAFCSHDANSSSTPNVCALHGAQSAGSAYKQDMPKKTQQIVRKGSKPDWFLPEWMATLGVSQASLAKQCDWSRGTMHGIYHGRTEYYRELVNLLAEKLNIRTYELLMHPDDAMALRRLREDAIRVVETGKVLDAEEAPRRAAR